MLIGYQHIEPYNPYMVIYIIIILLKLRVYTNSLLIGTMFTTFFGQKQDNDAIQTPLRKGVQEP